MPWFKCYAGKRVKLVVARDREQAERLANDYLELPYAKCYEYKSQVRQASQAAGKKKPVGVRQRW